MDHKVILSAGRWAKTVVLSMIPAALMVAAALISMRSDVAVVKSRIAAVEQNVGVAVTRVEGKVDQILWAMAKNHSMEP